MLQVFGYISAALSIIMVIPYIRDIFKHQTKPERATWFIWTVLGFIAFASQFAKGATDSLWLTAGQTVAILVVLLLSIKYGVGGLTNRDLKVLGVATVGLVLWYATKEAAYALFFVILVDVSGSILTILKSWEDPGSETVSTFILSGISGFFGLLAVGRLSVVLLVYPLYIFIANFVIAGSIILGNRKLVKV